MFCIERRQVIEGGIACKKVDFVFMLKGLDNHSRPDCMATSLARNTVKNFGHPCSDSKNTIMASFPMAELILQHLQFTA